MKKFKNLIVKMILIKKGAVILLVLIKIVDIAKDWF